jgi:hypothetical protein
MMTSPRGFALSIAVIITSVVLAVGIALLDVAYKQVLLSSSAKNSQYAFYNADSALECALYWDQKLNAFDYSSPLSSGSIRCDGRGLVSYVSPPPSGGLPRTTTYQIACQSSGISASVTVIKQSSGSTDLYANGYNTCDAANPNRIERGLKASY